MKKGTYKIEEDLSKTKLEGAYEKSIPTKSVPVTVTLPVFKAEGGTFTTGQDALHVYPKNSVDEPTIVKSVTQSGNMNDTAGVGEIKQFIIESVMPEEIEAYKVLTYVDKLSQGLTYKENLVVKKIAKGSSDAQVVESSNYTTNVVGTKGAKITIAFKPEFISTLRAGDKLVITYDSIINTDAVMGKSNPNEVELEYGRASDNTKKKKPENPELHTGGKKFVKKSATDDSVLQNAEFIVKRTEDNKYVKVDGDVVSFVGTEDEATKFKSDKQGIIDIKGLPYGKMGDANDGSKSTEYKLIEKVAPEGYALDSSEHKFNVSKTSYYENPDAIELKPVDPEKILNNKVTIPQTGGIGSVVVVAAGIAIVGLGLYLKRKNSRA